MGDSIYSVHKLLRRNKEDLTDGQREFLKTELEYTGTYGRQIYAAWQGKELLRDLLGLTVTRSHFTPDHSAISAARHRFFAHVADQDFDRFRYLWPFCSDVRQGQESRQDQGAGSLRSGRTRPP